MRVLIEPLSPGVQHHGDADFSTEPAGIATKSEQGLCGGAKQQFVDECRVALGQWVERMG